VSVLKLTQKFTLRLNLTPPWVNIFFPAGKQLFTRGEVLRVKLILIRPKTTSSHPIHPAQPLLSLYIYISRCKRCIATYFYRSISISRSSDSWQRSCFVATLQQPDDHSSYRASRSNALSNTSHDGGASDDDVAEDE
jgi:hypothetical protein